MPTSPRAARRKRQKRLAPLDVCQRYEIPEASDYLRQSPAKTWRDIQRGILHVIREDGRTFVPGSEIARRSALSKQNAA
jgi:hypothetical protein